MSNWLHNLPVVWMALVVFGFTYLVAAAFYVAVMTLAVGGRARSFNAVSPGMLPPLGIIFGLFVAFTAAQVWNDTERANAAVDREASALRAIVVMAANLPEETAANLRGLMRTYIEEVADREWPMMAERSATLTTAPGQLVQALQLTIALTPSSQGQQAAQRELITAIETVFDARRQRIITSQSQVNPVKWLCIFLQAACALLAIAMVHSDNRLAAAITLALFATGVAASVLLIAAHDRPFTGETSVRPDPLLQVMPQVEAR
jgi:Protein of unknown function (DUF4239)